MSEETEAEVLDKAKRLGYDPDRYAKDDPKWKSPQEFLDFGERLNPILRENNKRLEEKNAALEAQIKQIQTEVQKFALVHEQTQKEAYAKALADLKARKVDALSNQDYEAVVALDEEIAATKAASVTPPAKPAPHVPGVPAEIQEAFSSWAKENPWAVEGNPEFNEDMEAFARAVGDSFVRKEGVATSKAVFESRLAKVAEKVKERFPEKFENPNRKMASVEGAAPGDSGTKLNKHTYSNLPKEAQEACDLLVNTGTFKSREEYLAKYRW